MDINKINNNIFNSQQNIYDSNFRYTVIPFSREQQGPLLSLVYFINNNPYKQKNHMYFHAACSKFIFHWVSMGNFLGKYFLEVWVELFPAVGNLYSFFEVHQIVRGYVRSWVNADNKKCFFDLPFSPMCSKSKNALFPQSIECFC